MTTSITATCACRNFSLTVDFPDSSLPLSRSLCLCSSCRRVSGSCGVSSLTLPANQTIDISKWKLTRYNTSNGIERYFCSICGAHAIAYVAGRGPWHSATGLWDRSEGLIKWEGCKWVEGTLDGGISVWLREIVGADGSKRPLKRWLRQDKPDGELVPGNILMRTSPKGRREGDEKLKAQCHCGGVKFYITRPNEKSKELQSPFPDLMVPYHSHSSANPNNDTWWLRENDTKYLAGTCTCTSCRSASGYEIQPWAFVPKCNIVKEDGSPLDFKMGTLKTYDSSKGISREFCGVCGATVFWHCEERPDLIDVSVGLLDPEEGARVESWLDWWMDRVSFKEMAVSTSLVSSLEDGLKKWGKERSGK